MDLQLPPCSPKLSIASKFLIKQRCLLNLCRDHWLRCHASKAGGVGLISGWGAGECCGHKNKTNWKQTNKKPYSSKRSSLWEDFSNVSEGENLGKIFTGFVGWVGGSGLMWFRNLGQLFQDQGTDWDWVKRLTSCLSLVDTPTRKAKTDM